MNKIFRRFENQPRQIVEMFLGLTSIAGIILLVVFLYPPSEVKEQFLFGLSHTRFAIGILFLFLLLVNIGVFILSAIKGYVWLDRIENKITALVFEKIVLMLIMFYIIAFLTGMLLLLTIPPIPFSLSFLESIRVRLISPIAWLFLVSSLSIILLRTLYAEKIYEKSVLSLLDKILTTACIILFTFVLYERIAIWIGWINKTRYSYWNLLAEEFLKGNLYLSNPPYTHDLTLYNGKWYVPNPPLPAILMMPIAYLVGGNNINTADLSMFLSAVNSALIFLILDQLAERQWIKLSQGSIFWLVVLFAFGTPHLWVGINGRMWFVSQILTVTLLAFATLAALKSWSPWVVGICIGLAVATRPNGLLSWPFVFAIAMQITREKRGDLDFKQMLAWSIKSAVPIGVAIAGLLLYNYLRFDNLLDFGYVTINGDPDIVQNAQTYGLFSPHYIAYNLRVMFLYLPELYWGTRWPILPSGAGMSMFLVTPPLIYLFHRYEFKGWIIGAWIAVFLNFVLLILYHNTGKDQFGYRYILDAIVPLIAMLAVGFGKKVPWHFVLLLILSIVINLYGADWFMNG